MTIHTNSNGGTLEVHTLKGRKPQVGDLVTTVAAGTFHRVTEVPAPGSKDAWYGTESLETGLPNGFRLTDLRVVAKRDHAAVEAFCAPIREAYDRTRFHRTEPSRVAPIEQSHPSTTRYAIKAIDLTEGQVVRDRYGRVLTCQGVHHGLSGVRFTLTGEGVAVDLSLSYDQREGGYLVTFLPATLDHLIGMGEAGRCLTCDARDCGRECKRPWMADRA